MRAQVLVFLLVGFVVGFAGVYTWEKQRAPAIVRATPVPVDPNVPTDLSAGNSASEPPSPPLNMERVKELTSKLKQDPKDFDSIVELGNINFEQKNYGPAHNVGSDTRENRGRGTGSLGSRSRWTKSWHDYSQSWKSENTTPRKDVTSGAQEAQRFNEGALGGASEIGKIRQRS